MKKWLIPLVLALLISVAAGGMIWQNSSERPIRLAMNPWPGYEFLYLAEQKGYFKEEKLNLTLKQFSSLEDVRNAFQNHTVDGMCATLIELLQAKANTNKSGQVVLVTDYSNGADEIIAQKAVTDFKQLKGKKIGIEAKALGLVVLARALELQGLKLDEVDIIYLDQPSMSQALKEGRIDAAISYPPYSLDMKKFGNSVFNTRTISGEIIDVVIFDTEFLKAHPQLVPRLHRAWRKAIAFEKVNPDEAHAIMAKREGLSVEEFRAALAGVKILNDEEQANYFVPGGKLEQAITFTIDVLRKSKDLKNEVGSNIQFIYR